MGSSGCSQTCNRLCTSTTKTREANILHTLLKDFTGVLVSDFYPAYEGVHCSQQKCLVHLIRDLNDDLLKNPFDDDLKQLGEQIGELLRGVMATVDRFGLKSRYLRIHKQQVTRFYAAIERREMISKVAENYRHRILKYRDKLFR